MNKEKLNQLIIEDLESMDETEGKNALYDVYYEPNRGYIYLVSSGMAYEGDDKEAYEVAQIENQEVIHWHV